MRVEDYEKMGAFFLGRPVDAESGETVISGMGERLSVPLVAAALRAGLENQQPVTHLGMGQARVERVASNHGQDLQGHGFGRSSGLRHRPCP